MSRSGHPAGLTEREDGAALVGMFPLARGHTLPEHRHPTHQLAWAATGVLRVEIPDQHVTWVLTPSRALWIPAGLAHRTGATEAAAMRGVYLRPARCPIAWDEPTVLGVGPLPAALIDHLARTDLAPDARARAEAVLFDQLDPAAPPGAGPVRLAWPRDPRARTVADALAADPADDRDLAAWSRLTGASERTLARLFTAETGLGPGRWRAVVRVRAALELLAAGEPVGTVAHRVGYRTPSAFVSAFRREVGCTPGQAFAAS